METRDRIEEELKCPICLNLPNSTPIYQCQEGHLVCKDCHAKVNSCSICRATPLGSIRSLMAEKMLLESKFKCKFTDSGCELEDNLMTLVVHESKCDHETIECKFIVNGCDAKSKRFIITNHEFECSYQTIECRYKIDGCEVKSTMERLFEHEVICDFRLVPCKFEEYGCTIKWSLKLISNHESECEFQIVDCQLAVNGCEYKSFKNEMVNHELECEYWIASCKFKNHGCEFKCIAQDIKIHQENCEHRPIDCPNRAWDCEFSGTGQKLARHLKNCQYKKLKCKFPECDFESGPKTMKFHINECQNKFVPCKFSKPKPGCNFIGNQETVLVHEENCPFSISCSDLGINFDEVCNDTKRHKLTIFRHLAIFHYKTSHKLNKEIPHTESVHIIDEDGQIMKDVDFPTLFLVKKSIPVQGFLAKLKLRRDGSLSGGIFYIGNFEEGDLMNDLVYKITINKSPHSVTFTGIVPIYDDRKQFQYAMFVPSFQLRNLVDENGRVQVTFDITSINDRKQIQNWLGNSNESFDSDTESRPRKQQRTDA